MDRIRLRTKKKRRRERENATVEENRRLAEEFNEHYKKLGLKHDFKPEQIRRAYDEVERRSVSIAIMTNTIAVLWIMHRHYGYENRSLCSLATQIMRRVNWVGNKERSIKDLDEELKYDARLDCAEYWNTDTDIDKSVCSAERQRRESVLRTMPKIFPIHMHAVFYELFDNPIARKSEKLDRIARLSSSAAKYAVEQGKQGEYRNELAACGFYIDERGRFSGRDVTSEEYKRFVELLEM